MTGIVSFARVGERSTRIERTMVSSKLGDVLVLDLHGEREGPSLRDRLLSLERASRQEHVVLRGVSDFLQEQILDSQGEYEIAEKFDNAHIWRYDSTGARLVALRKDTDALEPPSGLLALTRAGEIAGMLSTSGAIWSDQAVHFVLPSGAHSNRFIRLGDIFALDVNVRRVADWCMESLDGSAVMVCDTYQILPLLQEMQLRYALRHKSEIERFILSLEGVSESVLLEDVANVVAIAAAKRARIVSMVSVTSSGRYIRRVKELVRELDGSIPITFLPVCSVGSTRDERALLHVDATQYESEKECELCREKRSTPIEIDGARFATRLGTVRLELPSIANFEEHALLIADADRVGALRVHVNRPDRHEHLTIFVDIPALLASRVFKAKATMGWARVCRGFEPEVILLPNHDSTDSVLGWMRHEQEEQRVDCEVGVVDLGATIEPDLLKKIEVARSILLVDDAVITGRTLHAMLELVQRVKARIKDQDFAIRAFILLARPESAATWKGLRDRFYIGGNHNLFAGWELNLPESGHRGSDDCPWCTELEMLERIAAQSTQDNEYVTSRMKRLLESSGLGSAIFFGSEAFQKESGWEASLHTTPGSYFGNISDVGAFVCAASMFQRMRNDWDKRLERWTMLYSMPLAKLLRRYTDPVIAAGFLRSVRAHELRGHGDVGEVAKAVEELLHENQHAVFVAELVMSHASGRLPGKPELGDMLDLLNALPEDVAAATRELARGAGG